MEGHVLLDGGGKGVGGKVAADIRSDPGQQAVQDVVKNVTQHFDNQDGEHQDDEQPVGGCVYLTCVDHSRDQDRGQRADDAL